MCVCVCVCVCVSACVCVCVCECECVCAVCVVCAWQLIFGRPIFHSTSSLGDQAVARVSRPTTDYKIVVRMLESDI